MATPRYKLVDPDNPCDYHLVSRIVRRSWLFGWDQLTGRDYSHRKPQLVTRIKRLANCFAVEIYAYSVMSNHYHLVARFDPRLCESWSDEEVARRWMEVYPPRVADAADLEAKKEELVELMVGDRDRIERRRRTLGSLSGFMQHLNQPIARQANLEDGCEGHFFQHRFYSGALLSEAAVIAAMAYVDLNPVRAKIAGRLEDCADASIHERLQENSAAALAEYLRPVASGFQHWCPQTPAQAAQANPPATSGPRSVVAPSQTPVVAASATRPPILVGGDARAHGSGHVVDHGLGGWAHPSAPVNLPPGSASEPAADPMDMPSVSSEPDNAGKEMLTSPPQEPHEPGESGGITTGGTQPADDHVPAGAGPAIAPKSATARHTTLGTYLDLLRSTLNGEGVRSDAASATAGGSKWLATWLARVAMIRKRQRAFGSVDEIRQWGLDRGFACRDGPLPD